MQEGKIGGGGEKGESSGGRRVGRGGLKAREKKGGCNEKRKGRMTVA